LKIGVLTGGGDAQGLNSVIQGILWKAKREGFDVYGIQRGYKGLIESDFKPMNIEDFKDIFKVGGTVLKTSRTNPYKSGEDVKKALETIGKNFDALIAIGGDDTLGVANRLHKDGAAVIGVPKTIDNDLDNTDFTIGFQTAAAIAAKAVQNLHTTAKSHERVVICEIMGRHAGWITVYAGLAGGAHVILLPEKPFDIDAICKVINKRYDTGANYAVIACSEGAKPRDIEDLVTITPEKDEFGNIRLGGISEVLAGEIQKRLGVTTRSVVLGHLQRSGSPNTFDRVFGLRLGVKAVQLVKEKKFGYGLSLSGLKIVPTPLKDLVGKLKLVDEELLELTDIFGE
jgi:phosphofructokinase-like protein